MRVTRPALSTVFRIAAIPAWPAVVFETDAAGAHAWQWTLTWDAFSASGSASTPSNTWEATTIIVNRGGTLTVTASAGGASASTTIRITGTNPTEADVVRYLSTKPNSDGFDRIIKHESKFMHFGTNDAPKRSFDKGYGMCQLTNPAPTFEQAWNWNLNVDGGLLLFAQKRSAARTFLGQGGRQFTDTQLRFESVCRWNGGQYHRWDGGSSKWIRQPNILCDSATGNIGWDMTDAENAGKTEAQLHARDAASYATPPPGPTEHWRFFGVCYADRYWASVLICVSGACTNSSQRPQATTSAATAVVNATAEQGRTRLALQMGNARSTVMLDRDAAVAPDTPPSRVAVVASAPRTALVVMDTYPSLAGGLSYCQAGEETFLRVISTSGGIPHVSYETKVGSCRDNLELADPGVAWDARTATVRVHWLLGPSGREEARSIAIRSDGRVDAASQK